LLPFGMFSCIEKRTPKNGHEDCKKFDGPLFLASQ
jgi:hypothetical protein